MRQLMITFTCHTEILTRDDLEKQADDLVNELGMSTSDFQVTTTTTTSTSRLGAPNPAKLGITVAIPVRSHAH